MDTWTNLFQVKQTSNTYYWHTTRSDAWHFSFLNCGFLQTSPENQLGNFHPNSWRTEIPGNPQMVARPATQNTICNLDFAFAIQNIASQMVGCYNFDPSLIARVISCVPVGCRHVCANSTWRTIKSCISWLNWSQIPAPTSVHRIRPGRDATCGCHRSCTARIWSRHMFEGSPRQCWCKSTTILEFRVSHIQDNRVVQTTSFHVSRAPKLGHYPTIAQTMRETCSLLLATEHVLWLWRKGSERAAETAKAYDERSVAHNHGLYHFATLNKVFPWWFTSDTIRNKNHQVKESKIFPNQGYGCLIYIWYFTNLDFPPKPPLGVKTGVRSL